MGNVFIRVITAIVAQSDGVVNNF